MAESLVIDDVDPPQAQRSQRIGPGASRIRGAQAAADPHHLAGVIRMNRLPAASEPLE